MDCTTAIAGLCAAITAMAGYIVKLHMSAIKREQRHLKDFMDLYVEHGGGEDVEEDQ